MNNNVNNENKKVKKNTKFYNIFSIVTSCIVIIICLLTIGFSNKFFLSYKEEDKTIKGDSGIDGSNGKDGAIWYHGSGDPSSSLGNNNDYYINILNSDVYLKTDNKWNKVTNFKGEIGEKGSDGKDGSDGEDGSDGKDGYDGYDGKDGNTYYYSYILKTSNGTIEVDKLNAIVGEKVTFIFTPSSSYSLEKFTLDGKETWITPTSYTSGDTYTYEINMKQYGFVIGASFIKI